MTVYSDVTSMSRYYVTVCFHCAALKSLGEYRALLDGGAQHRPYRRLLFSCVSSLSGCTTIEGAFRACLPELLALPKDKLIVLNVDVRGAADVSAASVANARNARGPIFRGTFAGCQVAAQVESASRAHPAPEVQPSRPR